MAVIWSADTPWLLYHTLAMPDGAATELRWRREILGLPLILLQRCTGSLGFEVTPRRLFYRSDVMGCITLIVAINISQYSIFHTSPLKPKKSLQAICFSLMSESSIQNVSLNETEGIAGKS